MNIPFEKYHGTGNDFIIVDIRNHAIPDDPAIISYLCDRHFGIGADGLIMLDKSAAYDFVMRYFNADGKEASMCGNGGRCITGYAEKHGIIKQEAVFLASDGPHHARINKKTNNSYIVDLQIADVKKSNWEQDRIFIDTGSPHLIQLCEGLKDFDVVQEGRKLRFSKEFAPEGTNVNFIEEVNGVVHIRTYERGVEAETLSCGTGVSASAIAWALRNNLPSPIEISAVGGILKVYFQRDGDLFTEVRLEGPAEFVFSGKIDI